MDAAEKGAPDYLFKIILLGDSGVGKTSLMRRYVDKTFSEGIAATIGVDFKIKTVHLEDNKTVKLQLWDTAGQEKFRALVGHYYRGSNGIILVYDLTKRDSFENLESWMKEIEKRNVPSDVQISIIGNKEDLEEREVSKEEFASFIEKHGIAPANCYEASAKDGKNVEEIFTELAKTLVKECKDPAETIHSKIAFSLDDKPRDSRCC